MGGRDPSQPRFPVAVFFIGLAVAMALSMVGFVVIEWGRCASRWRLNIDATSDPRNGLLVGGRTPNSRLLLGQAALAFIENGLYATLLPSSLALYPNHESLVTISSQ